MDLHDEIALETYRRLGDLGVNALKACYLLNGGAAIALLAFIPHVLDPLVNSTTSLATVPRALGLAGAISIFAFVVGVTIAAIAHGLAYMMQLSLHNERVVNAQPRHTLLLRTTIGLVFLSIAAFIVGACVMALAFINALSNG